MVAKIIADILAMITGVGSWLVEAFESITTIIYADGAFTTFGSLLLVALASSFVFYGLKMLISAVRRVA